MSFLSEVRSRASKLNKTVVLPESEDRRTLEAIPTILKENIANVILIGKESIRPLIKSPDLSRLQIIDPAGYKDTESIINEYYELRKLKGITLEQARDTVHKDYITFGAMLVRRGLADGFVAGASHTTPDVIRVALRCMQIDKAIGVIAGSFVMEVPASVYGENGVFVFADCGVNPEPNARQLAGIAVMSAELFGKLIGATPRVAFLSYSSKGSAEGPLVAKVKEAVDKAREMSPGILVDGEFQVDSAIVPEVAKIKCGDSPVAGKANVLIFPDLNSGNIAYKLTQRLANARAVGPLLMGFAKPCSDLSRGCNPDDIVDAVAITAIRS